ncbi:MULTISPECIES: hypothetical protein [unclassified Streptomyces]|uniref:hypothetical protein n=1 Tax=unclassified Streptomyces TaxID=2593676 RepID=UPI00236584D1|nr:MULTISPECIES: hypothetical protein [unclassified Streptomyces]MDF3141498.1 hypothetical protein [Streptomyces sp. T21Q-yed]WDF45021.1 hypothetical protein PBV52_50880 [Streptomyces sp. T12]
MNKRMAAAVAAATTAALVTLGTATSAAADNSHLPGANQPSDTYETRVWNPDTQRYETGTVTEYPDVEIREEKPEPTRPASAPAPSTSGGTHRVTPAIGVAFRTEDGVKTSSGISPRDRVTFHGTVTVGGTVYYRATQTTTGLGGWGALRTGLLPAVYVVRA